MTAEMTLKLRPERAKGLAVPCSKHSLYLCSQVESFVNVLHLKEKNELFSFFFILGGFYICIQQNTHIYVFPYMSPISPFQLGPHPFQHPVLPISCLLSSPDNPLSPVSVAHIHMGVKAIGETHQCPHSQK